MSAILAFSLILFGGALVLAMVFAGRVQSQINRRRMDLLSGAIPGGGMPDKPASLRDAWAHLDEPFVRFFSLGAKQRWGMHASAVVLFIGAVLGAAGAWEIFYVVGHLPALLSLALAALFAYLPNWSLLGMQQARADAQFLDHFPDAIETVIRILRAGLPVTSAIRVVASEKLPPVNDAFKRIADQMDVGTPLAEALLGMSERIALPDVRFFAVAVSLQQGIGGNLTATLANLAEIIRKRRGMRLKAKALTGEVRMSANMLMAIPFLVFGIFWVLDRSYAMVLILDHRGNMVLIAAAACLTIAFVTMRWMMRSAMRV